MFIYSEAIGGMACRSFSLHSRKMSKALERLTTGLRINSAADDPAGLGISERMRAQIAILQEDQETVADHMSMISTADGLLSGMNSMLSRMGELAARAATGTLSDSERRKLDDEYQQLMEEVNRSGIGSTFGSKKLFEAKEPSETVTVYRMENIDSYLDSLDQLLTAISQAAADGDEETLLSLGIDRSNGRSDSENLRGAVLQFTLEHAGTPVVPGDGSSGDRDPAGYEIVLGSGGSISVNLPRADKESLGLKDTDLLTQEGAQNAMEAVDLARKAVSAQRGSLGAVYNRLEHTANMLSNMEVNLTDAMSRITDADMAKEMMNYIREKLLTQVSGFVMAQVKQRSADVLYLLEDQ